MGFSLGARWSYPGSGISEHTLPGRLAPRSGVCTLDWLVGGRTVVISHGMVLAAERSLRGRRAWREPLAGYAGIRRQLREFQSRIIRACASPWGTSSRLFQSESTAQGKLRTGTRESSGADRVGTRATGRDGLACRCPGQRYAVVPDERPRRCRGTWEADLRPLGFFERLASLGGSAYTFQAAEGDVLAEQLRRQRPALNADVGHGSGLPERALGNRPDGEQPLVRTAVGPDKNEGPERTPRSRPSGSGHARPRFSRLRTSGLHTSRKSRVGPATRLNAAARLAGGSRDPRHYLRRSVLDPAQGVREHGLVQHRHGRLWLTRTPSQRAALSSSQSAAFSVGQRGLDRATRSGPSMIRST